MYVTVMSLAAVSVTIVRPVSNRASYVKVTGMGEAGIVIVPILVPEAAVLSYTVTTAVAVGLLKVMVCKMPGVARITVVVGAAAVILVWLYPVACPVFIAMSF